MVLISSIYWMSLFVVDDKITRWQLIFVVIHLLIYVSFIYRKEKIVVISRKDNSDAAKYKICFKRIPIKIKHPFYMGMFCVVIIAYLILWKAALSADNKNQDVDRTQYLKFLYSELGDKLVEKKIIMAGEDELSYERLDEWYDNLPL